MHSSTDERSGAIWLRFFVLGILGLALVPSFARAHLGHIVIGAERYLKFDAQPDGLRVVVSMTYGSDSTLRVMRDADQDEDGEVVPAESDAYMQRFAEGLAEGLVFSVDGEPVVPEWGEAYFDPQGRVRAASGAAELVARIPLGAGEHTVEVVDRMADARIGRTDVAFRAAPEGELLGGGLNEAQTPAANFSYANAEEVRIVTRLRVRGVTPSPWVLALITALGLPTGAALSIFLRRRSWARP